MTNLATLENTQLRVPQWSLQDRLRKARAEARLGQVELGELIGASQASIVHWEAGRRVPRAIYLREWARCCRVPLEWLETGMAPDENDGSQVVRPKGFEPLTFWSVVSGWHDSAIPDTEPVEWTVAEGSQTNETHA